MEITAFLAMIRDSEYHVKAVLMFHIFSSILEEDSVFDESDVHDTPTGAANKESQTFFARLKRIGGSKSVKYQPVELNAKRSKKCSWSSYKLYDRTSTDSFSA